MIKGTGATTVTSDSSGNITINSTDTNTWRPLGTAADTACAGNDSRLSNARPASDVYSWAKASSKPTYTYSEVGAAPASHTHNYAGSSSAGGAATSSNKLNAASNSITSTTNDTTAKWGQLGNTVHFYGGSNQLIDQPNRYGLVLNLNNNSSEVHQLWLSQASGSIYHRGGNSAGWSGTWRTLLDSSNYTSYAATASHTHSYAGASSAGGSATSAVKLDTATAGSATQPCYFSGGKPVACSYTLGKSVPSNAVFTDTNTHWTTRIYAGASGTAANAAASNPYVKITDDNTYRNQIQIKGSGATTVSSDANGVITISSTDNNTWRSISDSVSSTSSDVSASSKAVKTAYDKAVSAYNLANGKTSNTGTVTSVATGKGLTGGTITGSGTIKCNLNSETSLGTIGTTSKLYAVGVDANNKLCVSVPWTDNNTTYTFTNKAATLAWGSSVTIATVGGTNITATLPANPNSDTKVTQTVTTTNANYPLLFAPSGQKANTTTTSYFNTGIYANASTKSLYATNFYSTSDKQFKTNIESIITSDNCPKVRQFDWKENGSHSYGFIAQELEEQGYKELVSTNEEDGSKTVNYSATLSLVVGKM